MSMVSHHLVIGYSSFWARLTARVRCRHTTNLRRDHTALDMNPGAAPNWRTWRGWYRRLI